MPAQLYGTDTLETFEGHILFTRAALEADDDARDLLAETDSWLPLVDAARLKDRDFRSRDMGVSAGRAIANIRLDVACVNFGRDLLHACGGDRSSQRFRAFFSMPPWRFVKQPFDQQIKAVNGWLTVDGEAVLGKHKEELAKRTAEETPAPPSTPTPTPT